MERRKRKIPCPHPGKKSKSCIWNRRPDRERGEREGVRNEEGHVKKSIRGISTSQTVWTLFGS